MNTIRSYHLLFVTIESQKENWKVSNNTPSSLPPFLESQKENWKLRWAIVSRCRCIRRNLKKRIESCHPLWVSGMGVSCRISKRELKVFPSPFSAKGNALERISKRELKVGWGPYQGLGAGDYESQKENWKKQDHKQGSFHQPSRISKRELKVSAR